MSICSRIFQCCCVFDLRDSPNVSERTPSTQSSVFETDSERHHRNVMYALEQLGGGDGQNLRRREAWPAVISPPLDLAARSIQITQGGAASSIQDGALQPVCPSEAGPSASDMMSAESFYPDFTYIPSQEPITLYRAAKIRIPRISLAIQVSSESPAPLPFVSIAREVAADPTPKSPSPDEALQTTLMARRSTSGASSSSPNSELSSYPLHSPSNDTGAASVGNGLQPAASPSVNSKSVPFPPNSAFGPPTPVLGEPSDPADRLPSPVAIFGKTLDEGKERFTSQFRRVPYRDYSSAKETFSDEERQRDLQYLATGRSAEIHRRSAQNPVPDSASNTLS